MCYPPSRKVGNHWFVGQSCRYSKNSLVCSAVVDVVVVSACFENNNDQETFPNLTGSKSVNSRRFLRVAVSRYAVS